MSQKTFWNKQANGFRGELSPQLSRMLQHTIPYLRSNQKALDFACATGKCTRALAKYVSHIDGIDLSDQMIQYAKEDTPSHLTNIDFSCGILNDLNPSDEAYDVIIAFNIFHLLDAPKEDIKKLHSLLKPGGLLISSTPCMGDQKNIVTWIIRIISRIGIFPAIQSFQSESLISMITDMPFDTVDKQIYHDQVPNLYLVMEKQGSI